MIIDFHSHILPQMDDGAKDITMSLQMLKKEKDDGVDIVIATPHFYRHQEGITSFLQRRNRAYELLLQGVEELDLPKVLLGAEVYFSPSLMNDENFEKLCIEDTKYLLLEMPYQQFSKSLLDSLRNFVGSTNVIPVMAHIERYLNFTDTDSIYNMMSLDVLGQINCSSLLKFSTRKSALQFIKNGAVHVIGTDAHNMSLRPPQLAEACKIIRKKLSDKHLNILMNNAENILKNAEFDDILNG